MSSSPRRTTVWCRYRSSANWPSCLIAAARGDLVPVFNGWRFDPMPLYLAYPPNRYVSAKLRVFVDWVVEVVGEKAPVGVRRRV